VQVREGGSEARPAVHLGEQVGDAHGRHHAVQALGQGLGLLGRGGLQRRDPHPVLRDADVLEPIRCGLRGDLGEAPVQQGAALGQVRLGAHRYRDG
jgi:hypothetical protein